jgi:hypothetical protein
LLEQVGAPGAAMFRRCRVGCTGIFIEDDEFVVHAGVNINGLTLQTSGYYCAKCRAFQNW